MEDINFAQPSLVGEDAVQLLRNGVITQTLGLVPWGSNHTLLVIVTANNMSALCIYKPRKGERPLWDFPDGTLCQRETAAYEVSKAIGWDIVPPTVLREGPYGTGSFQWFVEHDPGANYFTFGPEMESQLQHVAP